MVGLLAAALLTQAALALDTVQPERGPAVLRSPMAGELVALRVAARLTPDVPVGAAELLQELGGQWAREAAEGLGASLELRVSDDESILSLVGPVTVFERLVAIAREVLGQPDLSVASLSTARARAEDRVLARLERPEPRLRALLQGRLRRRPAGGAAIDRLDPEAVRQIAARLLDPAALRVVLVGDVSDAAVRSAFDDWPAHVPGARQPAVPAAALPEPQAHHAWAALGYPLEADPGPLAVAAELVRARVREAGLREGTAEAWPSPTGGALVVLGGAAPDDAAVRGAAQITAFPAEGGARPTPLARFLRRMIAEAAALAGPPAVAEAAASLRRDILLGARTASGRADLLGRWADVSSDGDAGLTALLRSLDTVTYDEVRAVLDRALAGTPVLFEVAP